MVDAPYLVIRQGLRIQRLWGPYLPAPDLVCVDTIVIPNDGASWCPHGRRPGADGNECPVLFMPELDKYQYRRKPYEPVDEATKRTFRHAWWVYDLSHSPATLYGKERQIRLEKGGTLQVELAHRTVR